MTHIRVNSRGRGLAAMQAIEAGEDAKHLEQPTDKPSVCVLCEHAVVGEVHGPPPTNYVTKVAVCKLVGMILQFQQCSDFVRTTKVREKPSEPSS